MTDFDDLVERLRAIEEELRDLAFDRLRSATEDGDADAIADEKKLLQARRAIARAITALGGRDDVRRLTPTLRRRRNRRRQDSDADSGSGGGTTVEAVDQHAEA